MSTVPLDVRRSIHCATEPSLATSAKALFAINRPALQFETRKPFRHNVLHAVRRDDRLFVRWFLPFIPDPPSTHARPVV